MRVTGWGPCTPLVPLWAAENGVDGRLVNNDVHTTVSHRQLARVHLPGENGWCGGIRSQYSSRRCTNLLEAKARLLLALMLGLQVRDNGLGEINTCDVCVPVRMHVRAWGGTHQLVRCRGRSAAVRTEGRVPATDFHNRGVSPLVQVHIQQLLHRIVADVPWQSATTVKSATWR